MTPRQKQLIERLQGHAFVKSRGGTAGIVGSYGKGAEVDLRDDTEDIVVIANTGDIDLEKERVLPSGADDSYFRANRQMFADHKYDIESGAGEARAISPYPNRQELKAWKIRCRIRSNPIGKAIRAVVEDTNQIGVSIGFVPLDYGTPTSEEREKMGGEFASIVRSWEWFETSFTLLPCNVACQSMAVTEGKSWDMVDSADRLLSADKIDREAAYALGMPIAAKRRIFSVAAAKSKNTTDGDIVRVRA